jgi:hypothetical protein
MASTMDVPKAAREDRGSDELELESGVTGSVTHCADPVRPFVASHR